MKKIVSIILVFVLLTSLSLTSFAQNFKVKSTKTTLNELDIIEELKQKSDKELSEIGYSAEGIKEIRSFDINQKLMERAQLDKKILRNMGYTYEEMMLE